MTRMGFWHRLGRLLSSTWRNSVKCVDGPLRGRQVHESLGESWAYCLTPYYDWPGERVYGYYVMYEGEYWWHGSEEDA